MSEETMQPMVNFTDAAAQKVKMLIDEEGNPRLHLRVYVSGGGCAGFQYGFTFDEVINDDDIIITKTVRTLVQHNEEVEQEDEGGEGEDEEDGEGGSTVKLLIDSISFQYLQNAKIDYREDVNGEQFVISNPNAKTTCGCGSSFAA